jgi:hypothetical protein
VEQQAPAKVEESAPAVNVEQETPVAASEPSSEAKVEPAVVAAEPSPAAVAAPSPVVVSDEPVTPNPVGKIEQEAPATAAEALTEPSIKEKTAVAGEQTSS